MESAFCDLAAGKGLDFKGISKFAIPMKANRSAFPPAFFPAALCWFSMLFFLSFRFLYQKGAEAHEKFPDFAQRSELFLRQC